MNRRNLNRGRWLAGAVLAALAMQAQALTFMKVDLVCPLDGEKFQATLAGSGTSFGQYLDLKPYGPTAAPWPLAKCPASGFVMYKDKFTEEELARLREYVASAEYRAMKDVHSNYYLATKLRAHLGEQKPKLAYFLLQASWEARGHYERYASEALEAYQELAGADGEPKQKLSAELIAGELERRLGRFDAAKARFARVAQLDEAKSGVVREIVELQLRLVEAKDASPKMIPRKPAPGK